MRQAAIIPLATGSSVAVLWVFVHYIRSAVASHSLAASDLTRASSSRSVSVANEWTVSP
jgi:hypothetical protein